MNNKAIIWVIAVLALAGVGSFFLFQDGSQDLAASPSEASDTAEENDVAMNNDGAMTDGDAAMNDDAMMQSGIIIEGTDAGFSPSPLNVKVGDTVTFVNNGTRPLWPASALHPTHTAYDNTSLSEHCPDPSGTAFDACGGVAPGDSWSFTFEKSGEWGYHDHLNPRNFGKIIVE